MGRTRPKYMGISTVTSPRCILQQNVNYSRSACKNANRGSKRRKRSGSRRVPGVASRWFCWRRRCCCFGGSSGGPPSFSLSLFFFYFLLCHFSFFLLFFFVFLSVSLASLLSFYSSILPLLSSLSVLSSFFFFPSPVFIGKNRGGEWWGGHCWPPLHYPFNG